jgi:imidazole glycerol-phosphate synthase subunit HisF
MIKKRVISTLLWNGRELVKGVNFGSRRVVGSMMQAVRLCDRRDVDELVILDIAATPERRGPLFEELKEFTACCFMPITIGGGVTAVDDIARLLRAGADKVLIGSAIFDQDLIRKAAKRFGRQALVGAIDVMENRVIVESSIEINDLTPIKLAQKLAKDGIGEILLTSIDREGTYQGFDLDLIRDVSGAVNVPVVAAGGAGTAAHLLEAFNAGADAVAVGSMFLFRGETPLSCRRYLHDSGVNVRL